MDRVEHTPPERPIPGRMVGRMVGRVAVTDDLKVVGILIVPPDRSALPF